MASSLTPQQILATLGQNLGNGADDRTQISQTTLALVRLLQSNIDFQNNLLMFLQANGIEIPDTIDDVISSQ